MIFVGVDGAEGHNDVVAMNKAGVVVGRAGLGVGLVGMAPLHELVCAHASKPAHVMVGLEVHRGLLVDALAGAGYVVYAFNPVAGDDHSSSHAALLADLVRTDRRNRRPLTAHDDEIRMLATAHYGLISLHVSEVERLRADLRDHYPAALEAFPDPARADALAVLAIAPFAAQARETSRARIRAALARAGEKHHLDERAAQIQAALRTPHPEVDPIVVEVMDSLRTIKVAGMIAFNRDIAEFEARLDQALTTAPTETDRRGTTSPGATSDEP